MSTRPKYLVSRIVLGCGLVALGQTIVMTSTADAAPPSTVAVKMSQPSCSPTAVDPTLAIVVDEVLVASRGLYRVHSADPHYSAKGLADRLVRQPCVAAAEPDVAVTLEDTKFRMWSAGSPSDAATTVTDQPAAAELRLDMAHALSTGRGTVVAVLDTGIDPHAALLEGRVTAGWDYVDDDADPSERADGRDTDRSGAVDESFGHGTFVAGMVEMVAPDATIMPLRVLDSNGEGNVFTVAQAITDAVDAGADVINLSFGTASNLQSPFLRWAVGRAKALGVVVVAAAGNDGSRTQHFPAAMPDVTGVGAMQIGPMSLTSFSCRGGWVDVAAPGTDLVGPFPGGRLATWSGTSMASPIVAGQYALLRSYRPALPSGKLREVVEKSATRMRDVGHGSVNLLGSLLRLTKP